MKRTALAVVALVTFLGGQPAEPQRPPHPNSQIFSNRDGTTSGTPTAPRGAPDSILTLDISGVESWDAYGSANNALLTELLGAGAQVTAVGWDLEVQTVGFSWLSDVFVYFDGSDRDGIGVFVDAAAGDDMAGSGTYSSGGLIDLGSVGVPDLPILEDGLLYIEFYEWFDDVPNAVDATYPSGRYDLAYIGGTPVPSMPRWALLSLSVLLVGLGARLLRKRSPSV